MERLLRDWLREKFPSAKQTTFRKMLKEGRVRVNGRSASRMNLVLAAGDRIELVARTAPDKASAHPLKIVFEDLDLLVVDKPAGLLTSTVEREKRPTALAIVQRYLADHSPGARAGLIHRLDRDASGLLVFSKSEAAYRSLKQQFFKHTVEREYLAVTQGSPTPAKGRMESWLVERADGTVRVGQSDEGGRWAVTEYEVVGRSAGRARVKVTLHTGRKHQIRVHLAARGAPIVGDRVYGSGSKAGSGSRLMLAAVVLGFEHPRVGERVRFEVRVPRDFLRVGE